MAEIRASRRGTPEQSDRLVGSLGLGSELSYPAGDLQLGEEWRDGWRNGDGGWLGGEIGVTKEAARACAAQVSFYF